MPFTTRQVLLALLGAALIATGAQIAFELPGTGVPQTAQTFALLVVAALLGARAGSAAAVVYLLLGAIGLPVFAEGGAGLTALTGRTGGFLLGFVPAALLAGAWATRSLAQRGLGAFGRLLAGLVLAHGVVLACGWLRLALELGAGTAFELGVTPFLAGAAVKSLAAALVVVGARRVTPG